MKKTGSIFVNVGAIMVALVVLYYVLKIAAKIAAVAIKITFSSIWSFLAVGIVLFLVGSGMLVRGGKE